MEEYIKEEYIIKNEVYESLKDSVTCQICECLMIEPMVCPKCQNTFCKKCIDSWKKKGGCCPNRCISEFQKVIEKNRFISKIKFKCIKGCGAEIKFDDLKKHYSTDCIGKKKRLTLLNKNEVIKLKKKKKLKYFQIITLGDTEVGKSSLIETFIRGESFLSKNSTNGFEYYPVTYRLSDGSIINIHINDTCGQEKYNSICERYYKKADGVLLVFDISNKESFDKIKNYYAQKIRDNCKPGIPILLLGNKTDLKDERKVTQEEAIDISIKEEYVYKETSCKTNENVANAFETIVEMWNIEHHGETPKRSLSDEKIENDDDNIRTSSFALTDRAYSLRETKKDNNNNDKERISLNNKKHKRKKKSC